MITRGNRWGRKKSGTWDEHIYTAACVGDQLGPTIAQGPRLNILRQPI